MKKHFCLILLLTITVTFSQKKETFTYAIKGTNSLRLDVYSPQNIQKSDSLPVVLWMHGGGFSGGKRDNEGVVKMMTYLTTKGYIGISISYRLLRKGQKTGFGCSCPKEEKMETFKQAAIDYLDAAKFIFENKNSLQIDPTRVIAAGSSAGAESILNAVYMKNYFVDELIKYDNVKFSGVFSLAGALVNINYITKENSLPTVMFHGTDDDLVPFSSAPHHFCSPEQPGYLFLDGSETIVKKLDNLNTSYYFHKIVGGKHELSSIPFEQLDLVLSFFEKTILSSEVIQTKKTSIKM